MFGNFSKSLWLLSTTSTTLHTTMAQNPTKLHPKRVIITLIDSQDKEHDVQSFRPTGAAYDALRAIMEEQDLLEKEQAERFATLKEYALANESGDLQAKRELLAQSGKKIEEQGRVLRSEKRGQQKQMTLRMAKAIIDLDNSRHTPEIKEGVLSEWDSEFWQNQDLAGLRESIDSFRELVGL